jgi:hypothetical protein
MPPPFGIFLPWAQEYVIQIADNASFTSPIITTEIAAPTQHYEVPVLGNGVYYWRVQARRDASTPGAWGLTETFYVSAPATPTPG